MRRREPPPPGAWQVLDGGTNCLYTLKEPAEPGGKWVAVLQQPSGGSIVTYGDDHVEALSQIGPVPQPVYQMLIENVAVDRSPYKRGLD